MRKPVTAMDVARLAGVSRSAVSRTLTEGASVSEETRRKVLRAAKELGYHRNALVRGMVTRRSGLVGVVIGDMRNPFMALAMEPLFLKLQRDGLKPLIHLGDAEADLRVAMPGMAEYRVDGVLFLSTNLAPEEAMGYTRLDIPLVVIFNSYLHGISDHGNQVPVGAVSVDNFEAGQRVADLLVEGGRRRIALIEGQPDAHASKERRRGFISRLTDRGLKLAGLGIGNYRYEDARAAARRLLSGEPRPDAVFCLNDAMAMAAVDEARGSFGLRVPEDLAVVGFDDIPTAAYEGYALTTVRQPIVDMVDVAVDMMTRLIDEPTRRPLEIRMGSELVRRRTA